MAVYIYSYLIVLTTMCKCEESQHYISTGIFKKSRSYSCFHGGIQGGTHNYGLELHNCCVLNNATRPAPNVLKNPPIILSSTSPKNADYSFLFPHSIYHSCVILSSFYCYRLLLELVQNKTHCHINSWASTIVP